MFVFYVGIIFQLVLVKGDSTSGKQMPPHLLEMSLNHMNMLLTDISNKIDFERKLLSQRDDAKNLTDFSKKVDDSAYDTWKRTVDNRYSTVEINKAIPEPYQNVHVDNFGPVAQWSTHTPLPINKLFGELHYANGPQEKNLYQPKAQYLPEVRSKLNVDSPDARKFFTPSTTVTKTNTRKATKKNLITTVNKDNSKYCSHYRLGQNVSANDTELCRRTIMNTTNIELPYRMAKEGMLNYLEDIIMEGLKNLATASWTGHYDPAILNNEPLISENSDVSLRAKDKSVNTKSAYKKMMQHFILKHPTLFRKYAKHHKRSHKSKHRKSHHKKHHHKRKQQTEEQPKPNYSAFTIKKLPVTGLQRFSQIDNKKMNPNILTRRSNSDNNVKTGKRLNYRRADISKAENKTKVNSTLAKEETELKDNSNKSSTTLTTHSNKLVQMIRGESSYSDEEFYLKTMLKDALYHTNFTTTTTGSPK